MTSTHLTPHRGHVGADHRARLLGQRGAVVWLTGLSGAGKSTIAYALERTLVTAGRAAYVLDGDNLRRGLCSDLGFSPGDRAENVRRVGEVAALLADAGLVAITSLISPYRDDRARVRARVRPGGFVEVFVNASLEVCERRDPKGLYRRARAGELLDLTGIGAPYEPPESPEVRLDTAALDVDECVRRIEAALEPVIAEEADR